MGRVRMSWTWVRHFPIFVYTEYLEHKRFKVKLIKGKEGDQNAPGYGPSAPAWHEYIQEGIASKDAVVDRAFKVAKRMMDIERR